MVKSQSPPKNPPMKFRLLRCEKYDLLEYDATDDFAKSIEESYRVIRERKANGGPGWIPKEAAE